MLAFLLTEMVETIETQKNNLTLLTKDNITFVLSVIGSLLGVINFVYTIFSNRKHIDLDVLDHTQINNVVQFFLYIQNQSASQICISSISINHDEKSYICELIPKKIRGTKENLMCTPMFPLNLAPQCGYQYFFEFLNCPNNLVVPGNTVEFVIHTNRGPIKKSVTLGDKSHYLHIR